MLREKKVAPWHIGVEVTASEMFFDGATDPEHRVRMTFPSGHRMVAVTRGSGRWQDSASRFRADGEPVTGKELVIVLSGWCAVADVGFGGRLRIWMYGAGDVVHINPNTVHNTFVAEGACIVALMVGDWAGAVRRPDPEFDALTKHLTADDIRRHIQEAPTDMTGRRVD